MMTALLFDLDGALVSTDALHHAAFQWVIARHGLSETWDEYVAEIVGRSNALIGARFLPGLPPSGRAAALDDKEAAYRDKVGEAEPAPRSPSAISPIRASSN